MMLEAGGWVWCDKWNEAHSDTLNPQGYILDGKQDYCTPEEHHRLYYNNPEVEEIMAVKPSLGVNAEFVCNCECHHPMGFRLKPGQAPPPGMKPCDKCKEAHVVQPEPVRDNPVPLTVRRHTEESMSIWRANLLNALPADLPDEDAQRIADELLEVAISESTSLRRKRLIDRLMDEAETLEDLGQRPVPKPVRGELFALWSNLMMDAAEEIRSVL